MLDSQIGRVKRIQHPPGGALSLVEEQSHCYEFFRFVSFTFFFPSLSSLHAEVRGAGPRDAQSLPELLSRDVLPSSKKEDSK